MPHRVQQIAPGLRVSRLNDVGHQPLGHQPSATFAGAGTDVDDVLGVADRVLVVLHHHQRVALVTQTLQGAQQDLVVARMQADGRLIQHIADALQIAAQLRCQSDALRLAAAERGSATVQCQVAQAHLLEKLKTAFDFGNQVARDVGFALAHLAFDLQAGNPLPHIAHAEAGNLGNANAIELDGARRGIEPRAVARGASSIDKVLHLRLGKSLFPALVVIVTHGVIKDLALLLAQLDASAHTFRAPAVLAVVGEQARIQFGVTGAAHRTGAFG